MGRSSAALVASHVDFEAVGLTSKRPPPEPTQQPGLVPPTDNVRYVTHLDTPEDFAANVASTTRS